MTCKCGSNRLLDFHCKHNDLATVRIPHLNIDHDGYNPLDGDVFQGDYTSIEVCMDCGQLQNWTPITDDDVKSVFTVEDEEADDEDTSDALLSIDEWMATDPLPPDAEVTFTYGCREYVLDINTIMGYRSRVVLLLEQAFGKGWRGNDEAKQILNTTLESPTSIIEAAAAYMIIKEIE